MRFPSSLVAPFYQGIAASNPAMVQSAAAAIGTITQPTGRLLLPIAEVSRNLGLPEADALAADLYRFGYLTTTNGSLVRFANALSAEDLGRIRTAILASQTEDMSGVFSHSSRDALQIAGGMLVIEPQQKTPGWKRWLENLHFTASALVAGGISTWAYYRFLTSREFKDHYHALIKQGAHLDPAQIFDRNWANDFATVPAMTSLGYLSVLVARKFLSGTADLDGKGLMRGMQTANALSVLANLFKECIGEHDKLTGQTYSTFDWWDMWMYAASGALMHCLLSAAWWGDPSSPQWRTRSSEYWRRFRIMGLAIPSTMFATLIVNMNAMVTSFNLPISLGLFAPAIVISGLIANSMAKSPYDD